MARVPISGSVNTTATGVNILLDFYNEATKYNGESVEVDFYSLEWFDANLSALLNAIVFPLEKHHNINLTADFEHMKSKFDVLFRNGCLKHDDYPVGDDTKKTTIPCASFQPNEKVRFIKYIEGELMSHRGMPALSDSLKSRIKFDLVELFTNVYRHAGTSDPFFVSGQYYPNQGYLIFTMVDLGQGFLAPISKFTNGLITDSNAAIKWALEGNSTKGPYGGVGLQSIHDYCNCHNGIFQIATGNGFWGTDLERTIFRGFRQLRTPFLGSVINLFFNCE